MECLSEHQLVDLMEGLLPPQQTVAIDEHLDACPACRTLAAEIVKANVIAQEEDPEGDPRVAERPLLLERGTAVGRYLVLEVLGAGAMGVVYAAYDPHLHRNISLKLLRTDRLGAPGPIGRERLMREGQSMARLSHPNVAIVHDVGTFGDQVFIAMEHVDGGTLAQWLARGPHGWREVLARFRQAGRGLAAAHATGLVHRDFKASNVLLSGSGAVKVADFGLARWSGPGEETVSREVVGTPNYMAPEQRQGLAATAQSDQFSFCAALLEALDQERPPAWLRRALARGFSPNPRQRYAGMQELLAALSPRRRSAQRRWLALGCLLLLAAALVVKLKLNEGSASNAQRCGGGEQRFQGVWDEERRESMRASFIATGAPYAEAVFKTVGRAFDVYVHDWAASHLEACEATWLRGEQSQELLDLRMACLEERRRAVAELGELLSKPDPALVQQAVAAIGSLEPLSGCDAAAVKRPRASPASPEQAASVEVLRQRLGQIRALYASGRYSEVQTAMAEQVAQARQIGFPAVESEALLLSAQNAQKMGAAGAAEETLFSMLAAAERAGDDRLLAAGWIELIFVQGYVRGNEQAGLGAAKIAEVVLGRLGGDGLLEARLHNNLGSVLRNRGRLAEAQPHYERALALRRSVRGTDHPEVAASLANLGSLLELQGRYDEAAIIQREALQIFEQQLGSDHPDTAMAINNLGLVEEDLGRPESALVLYQQALRVRERALGAQHVLVATSVNNLCVVQLALNQLPKALADCRRALAIAEASLGADHPHVAPFLNSLGHALRQNGEFEASLAAFRRALAIREPRLGKDDPKLAYDLLGIGQTELARGRPQLAVPSLERALSLSEKDGSDTVRVAQTRFVLGCALWESAIDRSRAKELVSMARAALLEAGARGQRALSELDGWVRRQGGW